MGLRFGRALTVSALVAIAMAPAAACRTRRPTGFTEAVVDEPDRFPHASHAAPALGLGCRDCHGADGDARPGADDHAPCDRCHATEFQTTPGPLCRVCHTEPVDVTGAEK